MNQNNSRPLTNNAQRFECSRKTPRWAVLVPAYTASGIWVVLRLSITGHAFLIPSALLADFRSGPRACSRPSDSSHPYQQCSGPVQAYLLLDQFRTSLGPYGSRQIMTHDLLTTGFTCIFMCIFIDHGATNAWKRTTTTQNKRGFCAPPRVRPCSALCSRTHHEPRPKA